jgi:hypothetical protein
VRYRPNLLQREVRQSLARPGELRGVWEAMPQGKLCERALQEEEEEEALAYGLRCKSRRSVNLPSWFGTAIARSLTERAVKQFRHVTMRGRHDVGVEICGRGHLGVPEDVHDDAHGHAFAE